MITAEKNANFRKAEKAGNLHSSKVTHFLSSMPRICPTVRSHWSPETLHNSISLTSAHPSFISSPTELHLNQKFQVVCLKYCRLSHSSKSTTFTHPSSSPAIPPELLSPADLDDLFPNNVDLFKKSDVQPSPSPSPSSFPFTSQPSSHQPPATFDSPDSFLQDFLPNSVSDFTIEHQSSPSLNLPSSSQNNTPIEHHFSQLDGSINEVLSILATELPKLHDSIGDMQQKLDKIMRLLEAEKRKGS